MKRFIGFMLVAIACAVTPAHAQDFPNKQVVLVVPFAAGGPTDTLARNLGVTMTNLLKQQVIVDNAGGAGGTIGINKVAKAKNDGYTLLLMHIGMSTSPALYRKLPYDTLNDFEYIGQVADVPMTMLGKKALPPNNLKELLPYLKANKAKLTYANAGLGAASHLCGLLFMSQNEIDLTTVPYKGTAPAITDVMGGQVQMMFNSMPAVWPLAKAGKLRAIAHGGTKRSPAAPDVPTVAETIPGFQCGTWYAMFAPRATPQPIVNRLNAEIVKMLNDPPFAKRLSDGGQDPQSSTPDELAKFMKEEQQRFAKVIKAAGLTTAQ